MVDLGEERPLVSHVVKHVDEIDRGERSRRERQRAPIGHDRPSRPARDRAADGVEIDVAGDDAEAGRALDLYRDRARAGPEIEHRARRRQRHEVARNKTRQARLTAPRRRVIEPLEDVDHRRHEG
jgi:hypothetical protein